MTHHTSHAPSRRRANALAAFLLTLGLQACSDKPQDPSSTGAPGSAPAATASAADAAANPAGASASAAAPANLPTVSVTSTKARKRDFAVALLASGTVMPLTSVDLRAQTNSTISKVHFKEGDFVKAGQLLFSLDARNDEANLSKALAQLARDNASLADAKRQHQRALQLLAQNFVSQGAVDTALAQVEAMAASCAADQAAIDAARVALSYDRIVAPSAARAGQVSVSAGSAVQANVSTLVTLVQLAPINVAFNIPQRNLHTALQAMAHGGAPVSALLPDNGGSFTGKLSFVDNLVDANSGTVKAKALFDNKNGALWPGAFVQVRQTVDVLKDAIVIPEAAIIQGLRGTVVYVIKNGHTLLRPVTVMQSQDGDAAVTGLQDGDSVVMDGKQNVRPNSPVNEKPMAAVKDGRK